MAKDCLVLGNLPSSHEARAGRMMKMGGAENGRSLHMCLPQGRAPGSTNPLTGGIPPTGGDHDVEDASSPALGGGHVDNVHDPLVWKTLRNEEKSWALVEKKSDIVCNLLDKETQGEQQRQHQVKQLRKTSLRCYPPLHGQQFTYEPLHELSPKIQRLPSTDRALTCDKVLSDLDMEEMMRAECAANTAFSGRLIRHLGGDEESCPAWGAGLPSEHFHRLSQWRSKEETGGSSCEEGGFYGDDDGGGGFGCAAAASSAACASTMPAPALAPTPAWHRRSSNLSGEDMGQLQQKVKLMCRFGGQIRSTGLDNRLTYVGGDTRIQTVNRDVSYAELMKKLTDFYGQPLILKYQLSNEGLDTLVTVSCEEDLVNMMEEYDAEVRSERTGARLKVFLFPASEWDLMPLPAPPVPLGRGRVAHALIAHPPSPRPAASVSGASLGATQSHAALAYEYGGGAGGADHHTYDMVEAQVQLMGEGGAGQQHHHLQHYQNQQQQQVKEVLGYVESPRVRPSLDRSVLDGALANVGEAPGNCNAASSQPQMEGPVAGGGGAVVAGPGQYHHDHSPYQQHPVVSPLVSSSPRHPQQQHHPAVHLLVEQQQQQQQQQEQQSEQQQEQQHTHQVAHHAGKGAPPLGALLNFDHFKKTQYLLLTGPTSQAASAPLHTGSIQSPPYHSHVMSPGRSGRSQQPLQSGSVQAASSPRATFSAVKNGVQGNDEAGGGAVVGVGGRSEAEIYAGRADVNCDAAMNRPLVGAGHLRTVGNCSSPREQKQQEGGGGSPYGALMQPPGLTMDAACCSPCHRALGGGVGDGGMVVPAPASQHIAAQGFEIPQDPTSPLVRRIDGRGGAADSNLNTMGATWRAEAAEVFVSAQSPRGGGGLAGVERSRQQESLYAWSRGMDLQQQQQQQQQNRSELAGAGGVAIDGGMVAERVGGGVISVHSPSQGGTPPDPFARGDLHFHQPQNQQQPQRVLESHGEPQPISARLDQPQQPSQQHSAYAHVLQGQYVPQQAFHGVPSKLGYRVEHQGGGGGGGGGGGHTIACSAPSSPRFPTRQVLPQQQQQQQPAFRGSPPQHEPHLRMMCEELAIQTACGRVPQQQGYLSASPPRDFGPHQRLAEDSNGSLYGPRYQHLAGLHHQQKMGSSPLSYEAAPRVADRGLVHPEKQDHRGHAYSGDGGDYMSFAFGGPLVGPSLSNQHQLQQQHQQEQSGAHGTPRGRYGSPMYHYQERLFEQQTGDQAASVLLAGGGGFMAVHNDTTVGVGAAAAGGGGAGTKPEGDGGGIAAEVKHTWPGDDNVNREEPLKRLPERATIVRRPLRLPEDREAFLAVPDYLTGNHRGVGGGSDDENSLSYYTRGGAMQEGISAPRGLTVYGEGAEIAAEGGGYNEQGGGRGGGGGCLSHDVPNSAWGAFIARGARGSDGDLTSLAERADCSGGSSSASSPGLAGVGQHQAQAPIAGIHLPQGYVAQGNQHVVYGCHLGTGVVVAGSMRTEAGDSGSGLISGQGAGGISVDDAVASSRVHSSQCDRPDVGGGHVEGYDIETGFVGERLATTIGSEGEGNSPAYVTLRGTSLDLHSVSACSQGVNVLDDAAGGSSVSDEKDDINTLIVGSADGVELGEKGVRSPVCAECGQIMATKVPSESVVEEAPIGHSAEGSAAYLGVDFPSNCPAREHGEPLGAERAVPAASTGRSDDGGGHTITAERREDLKTARHVENGGGDEVGVSSGDILSVRSWARAEQQLSHPVRVDSTVNSLLVGEVSLEMGEGWGGDSAEAMKRTEVVPSTSSDAAAPIAGNDEREITDRRKANFMSGLTISCSSIHLPSILESDDDSASVLILDLDIDRCTTTSEAEPVNIEALGELGGGIERRAAGTAAKEKDAEGKNGREQLVAPCDKNQSVVPPMVKPSDEGRDGRSVKETSADQMPNVADDDASQRRKPSPIAFQLENYKHQIIDDADLEELKELGSGTFGTVYHGKWKGTDVAIKRIKISCLNEQRVVSMVNNGVQELKMYCVGRTGHRGMNDVIVQACHSVGMTILIEVARVNDRVQELKRNLNSCQHLSEMMMDRRKRVQIALDAAFGMEYLHARKIIHFDLKCENLLVNMRDPQKPVCKVGDLGLSKLKLQTMITGGLRGTLPWMAPELLDEHAKVDEKVDVFSFGIIMWELLTGEIPYGNMHYGAVIGGIANNTLRPAIPDWCDPPWRNLMERCWATDVKDRPTSSEVVKCLREML
ncbi:hypothetical protein CBR_g53553 [Chara braunii]|uniref:Protein kinase domain-containing protein n=1 Tax=Chara braunii TaxID=69332 RepID=A0A388MBB2_CHABU|nr:hypothetical protein CBR_g53553 [Chara braunii]|eukprot:GBG91739.1 hypothetical protein CBR_g53553 [Chara braunii]